MTLPNPHYTDATTTLYVGDCRDVLAAMDEASVDAVVTDPPYGLEFMGKDWDKFGRRIGHPLDPSKSINKDSDPTPRSPDNPWQKEASGYGAPKKNARCRKCKRLRWTGNACDCVHPDWDTRTAEYARDFQVWCEQWALGARRVLKPGGHLLAFGGSRTYHRLTAGIEDAGFEVRDQLQWLYGAGFPKSHNLDGEWDGWGTALKPAHEPVVMARKPLAGTVAGNVLTWGTGAVNIDGCRIATVDDLNGGAYSGTERQRDEYTSTDSVSGAQPLSRLNRGIGEYEPPSGRWPANVVLDEDAAAMLDEQSGERGSFLPAGRDYDGGRGTVYGNGSGLPESPTWSYGDSGGASRFFYVAKASRAERDASNNHPTVKPVALMRWLVRLVTPPDGVVVDPFAGSGTTGVAAVIESKRCVLIEREPEYADIVVRRLCKPIEPTLDGLGGVA